MCFLMFSFFFVLGTSLVGAGCIVLCQCVFLCFLCSLFWEPPWLGQVALFFVNVFSYVVFVLGAFMAGVGCIVLCQFVFLCFLCSLFWEPPWLGQVTSFFANLFSYVFFALCFGSLHGLG